MLMLLRRSISVFVYAGTCISACVACEPELRLPAQKQLRLALVSDLSDDSSQPVVWRELSEAAIQGLFSHCKWAQPRKPKKTRKPKQASESAQVDVGLEGVNHIPLLEDLGDIGSNPMQQMDPPACLVLLIDREMRLTMLSMNASGTQVFVKTGGCADRVFFFKENNDLLELLRFDGQ